MIRMTPEHDSDIAYYEAHVRGTRKDSLNREEWPQLDAEIVRIGEVRRLIQANYASPTDESVMPERIDREGELRALLMEYRNLSGRWYGQPAASGTHDAELYVATERIVARFGFDGGARLGSSPLLQEALAIIDALKDEQAMPDVTLDVRIAEFRTRLSTELNAEDYTKEVARLTELAEFRLVDVAEVRRIIAENEQLRERVEAFVRLTR